MPEVKAKNRTITLTFTDEDASLYEEIIADAKADRRSPPQFLLIHLAGTYGDTAKAVKP